MSALKTNTSIFSTLNAEAAAMIVGVVQDLQTKIVNLAKQTLFFLMEFADVLLGTQAVLIIVSLAAQTVFLAKKVT